MIKSIIFRRPYHDICTENSNVLLRFKNTEKALKHFLGEDISIITYTPLKFSFFVVEDMWLIVTDYEPDATGGGYAFMIDAKNRRTFGLWGW